MYQWTGYSFSKTNQGNTWVSERDRGQGQSVEDIIPYTQTRRLERLKRSGKWRGLKSMRGNSRNQQSVNFRSLLSMDLSGLTLCVEASEWFGGMRWQIIEKRRTKAGLMMVFYTGCGSMTSSPEIMLQTDLKQHVHLTAPQLKVLLRTV